MKILLVHAPIFFNTVKRNVLEDTANAAPPLGLAYLASMVKNDSAVEIVDAQGLSEEELKNKIAAAGAEIVGISATSASAQNAERIAGLAKEINPQTFTVLGGPHLTAAPEDTMELFTSLDLGVIGDGEEIFREIVRRRLQKKSCQDLAGVAYRDNGTIKVNPPGKLLPLDELPFPAWELLPPPQRYSFNPSAYRRRPHCIVIASRGCPYQCIFCHVSRFRPTIRYRSARNIVDEIEYLMRNFGIKEVRFGDELFAVNKRWAGEVCQEIRQRKLKLIWSCEARADSMSEEFAHTLKAGGCWQITMGVESGSPVILEKIKKGISLEQVKNTIKWAHQAGLSVRAFFMLGFPFESREDLQKTINFAAGSDLDYASFGYVVPFPGTELYRLCMELGYYDKLGWRRFDSTLHKPGCPPPGMKDEELAALLKRAYRSFYFRPRYWLKLLSGIRNSEDLRRVLRGTAALLRFNSNA
ncbi:MAG: radical SAM protein [Candidatus Omnitrophota bacterium]